MPEWQLPRDVGEDYWQVIAMLPWSLVLLLLTALLWVGCSRPASIHEVQQDLPTVSPALTPPDLPGVRWTGAPARAADRNAVIAEQLKAVQRELERPAHWPLEDFRTGAAHRVLRLSAPGAPPREVVLLRGNGQCPCALYLVEQGAARLLGLVEATALLDVNGDGRPEIIGSSLFGSGHFLQVQVWAWDGAGLWEAFAYGGPGDSGPFGFAADPRAGTRLLWVDQPAGPTPDYGLFTDLPPTHGPFLKDRLYFRWEHGTYRLHGRYRLATPFYHLNRYLYFAGLGDWDRAARHAEPGAAVDRRLAESLGHGPFRGSGLSDDAFVNQRPYFQKGEAWYYVDFGGSGRVLRLGTGTPGNKEEIGRGWGQRRIGSLSEPR